MITTPKIPNDGVTPLGNIANPSASQMAANAAKQKAAGVKSEADAHALQVWMSYKGWRDRDPFLAARIRAEHGTAVLRRGEALERALNAPPADQKGASR